jgi:hypothetical protein
MIFVWAFNMILWLTKLPFYLLPDSNFLPLPSQVTGAVTTLGGYTHWFLYLLGSTAGAAFSLVIAWLIPLVIAAYLWQLLFGAGKAAAGALLRHNI